MCSFWSTLKCSRTFGEPKEDISFIYNNIKWQTHSWRMIMFYSHLFLENIYIKFVDRGTMRSILSFWSKLIDGKQSKLSSLIYRLLYLKTHGNNTFSWINFFKSNRGQVIIPTAHFSDSPLLRQPISPITHYSDSPLLRQWQISTLILWYF